MSGDQPPPGSQFSLKKKITNDLMAFGNSSLSLPFINGMEEDKKLILQLRIFKSWTEVAERINVRDRKGSLARFHRSDIHVHHLCFFH